MIEHMSIVEAMEERKRILGFRSLSTADWVRVGDLCKHIEALEAENELQFATPGECEICHTAISTESPDGWCDACRASWNRYSANLEAEFRAGAFANV